MKTLVIVFAVIIAVLLGVLFFVPTAHEPASPTTQANSPVTKSADGHLRVAAPVPGFSVATSSISIQGTVVGGGWFFEGSFPVKVYDADGTMLGRGIAQAQGDWTSTGTVPFAGAIIFDAPHSATGTVVFSKDNPSGLPQNDQSLAIPISFALNRPSAP